MISKRPLGVFLAVIALCAFAIGQDVARITILHINDSHGQTLGNRGEDGKMHGGYPRLATLVQSIREKVGADHVLLLHAGDEFARGDQMTTQSAGAANVAIWNQLDVSAWTPGNGDFYPGASSLQKRIAEAKFPVLASNVSYRIGHQPVAENSVVLKVNDVRIGLFGLCFLRKEHPSSLPLKVEEPAPAAMRIVPELRKKSDIVLALNHLGLEQDRELARAVPGIDIIVGGHSHSLLPKGNRVAAPDGKEVLIVQAGEYLQYLGRVDLELTRTGETWTIAAAEATLILLDESVPEDPTMKALIAKRWPTTQPARPSSNRPVSKPAMID